jgi:hypothetical protein
MKLTIYSSRAFIDGTSKVNIYLCPSTTQQMLRKRIPWMHASVSAEDLVFSNFLPLMYNENERNVCVLGSETVVITKC